jgi:hypothetical protein
MNSMPPGSDWLLPFMPVLNVDTATTAFALLLSVILNSTPSCGTPAGGATGYAGAGKVYSRSALMVVSGGLNCAYRVPP